MQTISTRFCGCTNIKGSRIIARTSNGAHKVTLSYNHALNSEGNHMAAAQELMKRLGWTGSMIGGDTKDGMSFVFYDTNRTISN